MVAFIREPVREWLERLEADVNELEAGGIGLSRGQIDVRDFTPSGVITSDNFVEIFEGARDAALAASTADLCYNPFVPAGVYTLVEGQMLYIPSTGNSNVTPSLTGAGLSQTVFLVGHLPAHTDAFLTLGDEGETAAQFTLGLHVGGFTIKGISAVSRGNGIRIPLSLRAYLHDIDVSGFAFDGAPWTSGIGLDVTRPNTSLQPHQHFTAERVRASGCHLGARFYLNNELRISDCDFRQNHWKGLLIDGCGGAVESCNLQSATTSAPSTKWFSRAAGTGHAVSTAWSVTSGLGSGTGATLGTTSGGLCTLTGMSGLSQTDVGRSVELTAATPGSPELVSGLYEIVDVLSATSCTIYKNTTHSAATVSWQLRGGSGGKVRFLDSYDEGDSLSTFWFGRDESASSTYEITGGTYLASYAFLADSVTGKISYRSIAHSGVAGRLRYTHSCEVDVRSENMHADVYSRQGLVSKRVDSNNLLLGYRDAGGGRARSMRELVRELGAADAWDVRVTSLLSLSTADVLYCEGFISGSQLLPNNGANYAQYDAADSELGPVIQFLGGGDGGSAGSSTPYQATIDGSVMPGVPFACSLFAVLRCPDTGTSLVRHIRLTSPGVSWTLNLRPNVSSPTIGIVASQFDGVSSPFIQYSATADTAPHALVVCDRARSANGTITGLSDFQINGVVDGHIVNTKYIQIPAGNDIIVDVGRWGGAETDDIHLAFLAAFPFVLSEPEAQQLIDQARLEWPNIPK